MAVSILKKMYKLKHSPYPNQGSYYFTETQTISQNWVINVSANK